MGLEEVEDGYRNASGKHRVGIYPTIGIENGGLVGYRYNGSRSGTDPSRLDGKGGWTPGGELRADRRLGRGFRAGVEDILADRFAGDA